MNIFFLLSDRQLCYVLATVDLQQRKLAPLGSVAEFLNYILAEALAYARGRIKSRRFYLHCNAYL